MLRIIFIVDFIAMRKILNLSCFLVFFFLQTIAQQQANIWYFGYHGGLDFSSGTPTILTDGQVYTIEGVASISDANGNLLFYTDGVTVWNRTHAVMPNGNNLFGHESTSQSAIIVPKLNDPSRYYVFTLDAQGQPHGFNYSIVNMSLDGGLGDVEIKNVSLLALAGEKITAVKHCNGKDIWVIIHGWDSDAFYVYLITTSGINATPVVSHTGSFISPVGNLSGLGCMKASPNGKKLALAHTGLAADLCDFDNSTGIVSNAVSLFLPTEAYSNFAGPYGVEFSSNSKLLYLSVDYYNLSGNLLSAVLQYDASLPDILSIQASKKIVYQEASHGTAGTYGSLQMAPDGKIYLAEISQPFLSVINRPDSIGASCQFVHAQQFLQSPPNFLPQSTMGLPSFIQSYWRPNFKIRGECNGGRLYFDYLREREVLSVKWDFGDLASGPNNTSTLDSTYHDFSSYGIYTVKFIRYKPCGNDTIIRKVQAGQLQALFGNDTLICGGSGYLLSPELAEGPGYTYLWQNGSTEPTQMVNSSGLYWVEISNNLNGCFKRDSIAVTIGPYPQFNLGNDFTKCAGQSQTLSVSVPFATYLWSSGSNNSSQAINQTGTYWLDVTLDGCTKRDSVQAIFYPYPVVNLGKDTTICEDQTHTLDASNPGLNYLWQNNSTSQTYLVSAPGNYWVNVTDHGCSTADTIIINYDLKPVFTLGNDTAICSGMTIELKPTVQTGSALNYLWSTGSTAQQIAIVQGGLYSLQVTNDCGIKTDDILVKKGICKIYVPSGFTPNNDGLNDIFKANFGESVTDFKFRVHNRWGQLVFQTNDIKKGWDGRINGLVQPNGTYVWMIKYKTITEPKEQMMKGTVMLIR